MDHLDVLAFAAHPDDVELACAGTMVAAKRDGRRTAIVDLTRGELSTRGTLEIRAKETEDASRILGLDRRMNLGLPDGNIEVSRENMISLVRIIRQFRPAVLLSPHRSERHPDHEATAELVHRAQFYAGLAKIETQDDSGTAQEPHRARLLLQFMQTYTFHPTIVIDVSRVVEEKMAALSAYRSQFARPKNAPSRIGTEHETTSDQKERETFLTQSGFYEFIEARARHYGMMIGVEFGEPFWSHEPLGTKDLFSLVTKRVG